MDSGDILLTGMNLNQKADKQVFLIFKLDALNQKFINHLADKIYKGEMTYDQ